MNRKKPNALVCTVAISFLILASTLLAGCMSIHTAARGGNLAEVKRQLAWGANPNSKTFWYKDTPLIVAASYGHAEVVKLLLDKGAHVNMGNEGSETALHYAARHGHTKVMRILLEHGADPRLKGTGCGTPMQWAVRGEQRQSVNTLLDYGVSINQEGTDGQTALSTAVSRYPDMVSFLISLGADVNARAEDGCTPLHKAYWAEDKPIARLLLQQGADPTIQCNDGSEVPQSFVDQLRE
jgi:ankyrin repeat protein